MWDKRTARYQYEAKCDDIGEDGDIGGYDAVHEDVEVGEDGDAGGEVGEVDEVGGSDKVRQLLWSSTTLSCLLHNCLPAKLLLEKDFDCGHLEMIF